MKSFQVLLSTIALSAVMASTIQPSDARPSGSYSRSVSSSPSRSYSSSVRSYSPPSYSTRSSSGYSSSSRTTSSSNSDSGYWGMTRSQKVTAAAVAGTAGATYATNKAMANNSSSNNTSSSSTSTASSTPSYVPSYNQPTHYASVPQPQNNTTVIHHYDHSDSGSSALANGLMMGAIINSMHHDDRPPVVINNNGVPAQANNIQSPTASAPPPSMPTSQPQTSIASPSVAIQPNEHHSHGGMVLVFVLLVIIGLLVAGVVMFKRFMGSGNGGANSTTVPNSKKGIRGYPGFTIGNGITLSPTDVMSDPSYRGSENGSLHFEPASTGSLVIEAIGDIKNTSNVDVFVAYADKDIDFFRLSVFEDKIEEAKYYSLLDIIYPSNAREYAEWMDDDSGMIGSATFGTPDGMEWSRVMYPTSSEHMTPNSERTEITSKNGTEVAHYRECEYVRVTNFASGFPQNEYLLVREVKDDSGNLQIEIYAGVTVSTASLKFSLK